MPTRRAEICDRHLENNGESVKREANRHQPERSSAESLSKHLSMAHQKIGELYIRMHDALPDEVYHTGHEKAVTDITSLPTSSITKQCSLFWHPKKDIRVIKMNIIRVMK